MNPLVKSKLTFFFRTAGTALVQGSMFNLRSGAIAAVMGTLAVFLFRPGTAPDETVVFVIVPVSLFLALMRVLLPAVTRINLPQYPAPEAHIKLLSRIVLFGVLAVFVGVPSLFAYRALGIMWAAALTGRLLLMLLAATVLASLCVGMRFSTVYLVGVRFLKGDLQIKRGIVLPDFALDMYDRRIPRS
jgi:hypothetical protein